MDVSSTIVLACAALPSVKVLEANVALTVPPSLRLNPLELTTSYATVTGSELSYTPPSGTTCVVYDFLLQFTFYDAQGIGHFKFFIDSLTSIYVFCELNLIFA